MESHPKFHEVADICQQVPSRTRAVFQTYLDLKYAQMFRSTETWMNSDLNMPLITTTSIDQNMQVFVPVFANEEFSVSELDNMLNTIHAALEFKVKPHGLDEVQVHLAIVETDSTVVYYKIGNTIVSPEDVPINS